MGQIVMIVIIIDDNDDDSGRPLIVMRLSQVTFLVAVGGREDCHNPCTVK